mgnify:CR=1 FL=1
MRAVTVILLKRSILQHTRRYINNTNTNNTNTTNTNTTSNTNTNSGSGSGSGLDAVGMRVNKPNKPNKPQLPQLRIYCTGHSMGGALTTFASLDLSVNMTAIQAAIGTCVSKHITGWRKRSRRGMGSGSGSGMGNGSGGSVGGSGSGSHTTSAPLSPLSPKSYPVQSVQSGTVPIDRTDRTDNIRLEIEEPILTVYTFGAPRMGNKTFSKLIEQCLQPCSNDHQSGSGSGLGLGLGSDSDCHSNNYYRCVLDGDIVPMVPKQMLYIMGNWKHCGVGVLIDNEVGGNMIINPSVLEAQLLRKHSTGNIEYHSCSTYKECLMSCIPGDAGGVGLGGMSPASKLKVNRSEEGPGPPASVDWLNEDMDGVMAETETETGSGTGTGTECLWMDTKNDMCNTNTNTNHKPSSSSSKHEGHEGQSTATITSNRNRSSNRNRNSNSNTTRDIPVYDEFLPSWANPDNDNDKS